MYHVARHDVFQRHLLPAAGPLHAGGGVQHAAQPRRHVAAAGLLHKAQRPRDEHHRGDDEHRGVALVAGRGEDDLGEHRDDRQRQQHHREGVDESAEQPPRQRLLPAVGQNVRTVLLAGKTHRILLQSARRGAQALQQNVRLHARGLLQPAAQGFVLFVFGAQSGPLGHVEQSFHGFVPPFAVVQRWSPARPLRGKKIPPSGEKLSPKRRRLQEKGRRKPALRACAPAAAPRPPQIASTVTLALFHGAPASFPGKRKLPHVRQDIRER